VCEVKRTRLRRARRAQPAAEDSWLHDQRRDASPGTITDSSARPARSGAQTTFGKSSARIAARSSRRSPVSWAHTRGRAAVSEETSLPTKTCPITGCCGAPTRSGMGAIFGKSSVRIAARSSRQFLGGWARARVRSRVAAEAGTRCRRTIACPTISYSGVPTKRRDRRTFGKWNARTAEMCSRKFRVCLEKARFPAVAWLTTTTPENMSTSFMWSETWATRLVRTCRMCLFMNAFVLTLAVERRFA
jgi:hypothetical protein